MAEALKQGSGGKIPVVECFKQAWRFLEQNWRPMLPAAGITAALSQAGLVLILLAQPGAGGGETMLSATLWDLITILPTVVAGMLFTAVVLRKAVRDEFSPPTGLAFGADEARLLGAMSALMCVILPIVTLLFVVISFAVLSRISSTPEQLDALLADPDALALALETTLGEGGVLALTIFIALGTAAITYIMVRLTMVSAATIGERRIVIFQTWKWSRGNVWRMFGAILLTALPVYFISVFLTALRTAVLLAGPGDVSVGPVMLLGVNIATMFLLTVASIPTIALGAILYKGLRPADFVAK